MKLKTFSWVHPSLELRDIEGIGLGTFTKTPILKDEIVIVQAGKIVESSVLDTPEYEPYWYHCFQVEQNHYICPFDLTRESADGVFNVNHSCEPTCGFSGQVSMVALRDIAADEQITFDYAMSDVEGIELDWEAMECLCGTSSCRKTITGSDWKILELQSKYDGYFSRYVADLISDSKSKD